LIAQARLNKGEEVVVSQSNTGSNINMAKLPIFSEKAGKVLDFLIVYRLSIRIKIRNDLVKK